MTLPSYFSLSELLATGERLKVIPDNNVARLGFLNPSYDPTSDDGSEDLPAGTRMELPIWMVTALHKAKARLRINFPDIYCPNQRPILAADSSILVLPSLGPQHFYETGRHLLRFSGDCVGADGLREDEELGRVLVDVLVKRFRYILDSSTNSNESDSLVHMDRLDLLERTLYVAGQKSLKDIKNWFERNTDKIHTADMVVRHRKRKAIVLSS